MIIKKFGIIFEDATGQIVCSGFEFQASPDGDPSAAQAILSYLKSKCLDESRA